MGRPEHSHHGGGGGGGFKNAMKSGGGGGGEKSKWHRKGFAHRPDGMRKGEVVAAPKNAKERHQLRRDAKRGHVEGGKKKLPQKQQKNAMKQQHTAGGVPLAITRAPTQKIKRMKGVSDGEALLASFRDRLSGSTFRLLNEQLYTSPSVFATQLMSDPSTFEEYHQGYRHQLALWPMNPVDLIVRSLTGDKRGRFLENKEKYIPSPNGMLPNGWVVVDMGCGDAVIAQRLAAVARKQAAAGTATGVGVKVLSFDLCKTEQNAPWLTAACNMSSVPVEDNSVDVVVFCLSLMGTDWIDFIREAQRILRPGKLMKIVEVRSRLPYEQKFVELVEALGFKCDFYDTVEGYFVVFDFLKYGGGGGGGTKATGAEDDDEEDDAAAKGGKGGRRGGGGREEQRKEQQRRASTNGRLPHDPAEVLLPCVYKRR